MSGCFHRALRWKIYTIISQNQISFKFLHLLFIICVIWGFMMYVSRVFSLQRHGRRLRSPGVAHSSCSPRWRTFKTRYHCRSPGAAERLPCWLSWRAAWRSTLESAKSRSVGQLLTTIMDLHDVWWLTILNYAQPNNRAHKQCQEFFLYNKSHASS